MKLNCFEHNTLEIARLIEFRNEILIFLTEYQFLFIRNTYIIINERKREKKVHTK